MPDWSGFDTEFKVRTLPNGMKVLTELWEDETPNATIKEIRAIKEQPHFEILASSHCESCLTVEPCSIVADTGYTPWCLDCAKTLDEDEFPYVDDETLAVLDELERTEKIIYFKLRLAQLGVEI